MVLLKIALFAFAAYYILKSVVRFLLPQAHFEEIKFHFQTHQPQALAVVTLDLNFRVIVVSRLEKSQFITLRFQTP